MVESHSTSSGISCLTRLIRRVGCLRQSLWNNNNLLILTNTMGETSLNCSTSSESVRTRFLEPGRKTLWVTTRYDLRMALESLRKAGGGKGTPSARQIQTSGQLVGFDKCDFVVERYRRIFGNKRNRFMVGIYVTRFCNQFLAEVVRHGKTSTKVLVFVDKNKFVRTTASFERETIVV